MCNAIHNSVPDGQPDRNYTAKPGCGWHTPESNSVPAAVIREMHWLIVTLLAMQLAMIVTHPLHANWDVAMLLDIGGRILDGQRPYVDYYEINMPFVHYLHMVPAALARLTGWHILTVMMGMVWLLLAWSVWAANQQGQCYFAAVPHMAAVLPLALALASFLTALTNQYGQREHLFILLFAPYMLLRLRRWRGDKFAPWGATGIGLMAAVGVACKPHFAVFPLLWEGVCAVQERRRWHAFLAPELGGFILIALLHLGYAAWFPDVTRGLRETLALVWHGYDAYSYKSPLVMLRSPALLFSNAVIVLALAVSWWQQSAARHAVVGWGLFAALACAVAVLQTHGWFYHFIPFSTMVLVLAIFLVLVLPLRHLFLRVVSGYIILVLVFLLPTWDGFITAATPSRAALATTIARGSSPGDGILVLDAEYYMSYPLMQQMGRHQVASYLCAYPFWIAYHPRDAATILDPQAPMPPAAAHLLHQTRQDIARHRPALIIARADDPTGPSIAAWLEAHDFVAQVITPDYYLVEQTAWYLAWQRKDLMVHKDKKTKRRAI